MVINLRKEESSPAIVAKPNVLLGTLLWNQLPVQVWEGDRPDLLLRRWLKPSCLRKLTVTNSPRPPPCCISTILPPLPSQPTTGVSPI